MNSVKLIGRLAQEPNVRFTQNGKAVAALNVAVNRGKTDDGKDIADFMLR